MAEKARSRCVSSKASRKKIWNSSPNGPMSCRPGAELAAEREGADAGGSIRGRPRVGPGPRSCFEAHGAPRPRPDSSNTGLGETPRRFEHHRTRDPLQHRSTRIADVLGLVQGIRTKISSLLRPQASRRWPPRGRQSWRIGGSELLRVMAVSSGPRQPMAEADRVHATVCAVAGFAASA